MAYEAVKRMKEPSLEPENDSPSKDTEFLDVVHWMANMRGLNYIREIRYYAYAATVFADHMVKINEKAKGQIAELSAIARSQAKSRKSKQAGHRGPARLLPKSFSSSPRKAVA